MGLLAAALAVTGCEETELSGKACTSDYDCIEADAGTTAKVCVESRCAVVECSLDADCGSLGVCHQNRCRQICTQDDQCPSGQLCELGHTSGVCEYIGNPCTTNMDCSGGAGTCLITSTGMCLATAAVEVQDDAYGLQLGGAGDTTGDTAQTLGPICSYLYACACGSSSSSDLCYGIGQGYYSEAGCQAILEGIDYC